MTTKSFYAYDPQVAAAAVACAVFGANAIYALIQTVRKRSWVWLVMVFAIALDCFGFGVRIKSAADVTSRGLYIAQYLCIILAPVFMAGIIYVVFGRIVIHVIPARARTVKLLWVPARWATPIFVGCDLIALILQGAGAAIVVGTQPTDENAQDKVNRGKDIAMTGVAVQLAGFGVFSIVAARFHVISKQFASELESKILQTEGDKTVTLQDSSRRFNPHWKRILFAVNTSCALILIRSVYRMTEFAEGKGGYVSTYEWFMYVSDALPIALVVVIYNVFFPGSYLPHMGLRAPKIRDEAVSLPNRGL